MCIVLIVDRRVIPCSLKLKDLGPTYILYACCLHEVKRKDINLESVKRRWYNTFPPCHLQSKFTLDFAAMFNWEVS